MGIFSKLFGPPVAQISAADTHAALSQKDRPFLLDVRQPEEFKSGHISGAKLIPLHELARRVNELPRDRQIVCVCASGSRSSSAARTLASAGYSVVNMSGGMGAWARSGLPVKKGNA